MSFENDHPYWTVHQLVSDRPEIFSLTFSFYLYRPQSLIDERHQFEVPRDKFLDPVYMHALLCTCPKGFEAALHSTVTKRDRTVGHVPMIDMSTGSRAQLEKLKTFLGSDMYGRFTFFESGRSFHGYADALLSERQWIAFMGTLLLTNQKDMKPTVDPRWVGHRLIAGYSTLRWTKNTPQYITEPKRIAGF